jgi:putative methylase
MQRRLVRKLDLEMALSTIRPHPSPKAYWEQYTIPPRAAADFLYAAAYTHDDIIGKTIADLGCGTGTLAIGSVLLGARATVGVDIDRVAIKTAMQNAEALNVQEQTQWIAADVETVRGRFDTVLQNPPFGIQKRRADRRFLRKALEIGKRIYSIHKSVEGNRRFAKKPREHAPTMKPGSASAFLHNFIERHGGSIKAVYTTSMAIPHMFDFHTKRRHRFPVDIYVIESAL